MFKTLAAAAVITFCISRRLPQPTLASSYEPMHCDDTQASCSQHSFQQTNTGTNQTTATNLKWDSQAQNQVQHHIKEMHNHQTNHQQLTIKGAPYRHHTKNNNNKQTQKNKQERAEAPANQQERQTNAKRHTNTSSIWVPSRCVPACCRYPAARYAVVVRLFSSCFLLHAGLLSCSSPDGCPVAARLLPAPPLRSDCCPSVFWSLFDCCANRIGWTAVAPPSLAGSLPIAFPIAEHVVSTCTALAIGLFSGCFPAVSRCCSFVLRLLSVCVPALLGCVRCLLSGCLPVALELRPRRIP